MVWCALAYAGAASFLSWWVGRPLISLNAERYAREADFRFALVRANEEIDGITLYGGEADERARLQSGFEAWSRVSKRLVPAVTGLTWVTSGYGWFTIIAPIVVAAPAYFKSGMSLWRVDDPRRRFQSGAAVASMVRRQLRHHRGLASHAATRGEL